MQKGNSADLWPLTGWSSTRQMRVSCSRHIWATLRTGIAAANCSSNASYSSVNPDPSRAHGTPTCRTPWTGQRTRGCRACRNALYWKKSICRHILSAVSLDRAVPMLTILGRAPEPRTPRKVQIQIQPRLLLVELHSTHPPRRDQTHCRGEQSRLIHIRSNPPACRRRNRSPPNQRGRSV